MDIVNYLTNIYGYGVPIFLKDVRIGRKSKSAVKEELYRAVKNGKMERNAPGIYSIVRKDEDFPEVVTFEKIVEKKFLYEVDGPFKELFVIGYYSGMTFLNRIGLSEQVPMVLEITTNNTSGNKRTYAIGKRRAFIRKGKTTITSQNYKMLQFLDMFRWLPMYIVKERKKQIIEYIKKEQLSRFQFNQYISLYPTDTIKKIVDTKLIDSFI